MHTYDARACVQLLSFELSAPTRPFAKQHRHIACDTGTLSARGVRLLDCIAETQPATNDPRPLRLFPSIQDPLSLSNTTQYN